MRNCIVYAGPLGNARRIRPIYGTNSGRVRASLGFPIVSGANGLYVLSIKVWLYFSELAS